MVFIDSIRELEFYNPPPAGIPCYCETIIFPYDMVLQGFFPANPPTYTIEVYTMTVDGLTEIEDVTTNFEVYYFSINGQIGFNMRLQYFADSMCSNPCYILRVRVTSNGNQVFQKWTHRYCQNSCCDVAGGVTITQGDIDTPIEPEKPFKPSDPTDPKITPCGERLITLTTASECYDPFTGNFYGTPPNVVQGSASFSFYKFSNFKGRVVARPREIVREYSYNCSLQRVEATRQYLLEGFEFFPAWKMIEIEAQLAGSEIYIDGVPYTYTGGAPFTTISKCIEYFKLLTTLSDCTVRKVFGCGVPCGTNNNYDGNMVMFIVPSTYQDGDYFYDESGNFIADDWEELLNYIRNLDGVYNVTDLTPVSGFGCDVFGAFSFSGNGYLPTSIYVGSFQQANRIYSTVLGSADEICGQVGTSCNMPVIGTIVVEDNLCDAPEIGTIVVVAQTPTAVGISGYADWYLDGSETGTVTDEGYVSLHFIVGNNNVVENPDYPSQPVYVVNTRIATISPAGVPTAQIILTITADTFVTINTDGSIYYQGMTTTSTDILSTIEVNINYYK